MNFKLRSLVAATLAGSFLVGFGTNAMADSTTDIVNALVSKGVLTEEEGALLTKGREMESAGQAKAMKKASKLKVSDAIDNATVYGDIRVRHEDRDGKGVAGAALAGKVDEESRVRERYKLTLGVKTEAGNWYTDLALAMGANGRSDNATFGKSSTSNLNDKETVFVKRAMVGYKATDWLALEAGRMENPLYTTPMVWDADLTVEGAVEKAKFKMGDADVFLTAVQGKYQGDSKNFNKATTLVKDSGGNTDSITNMVYAFQGGAKYAINDRTSAKAAITYTDYSRNNSNTMFKPGNGTDGTGSAAVAATVGIVGGVPGVIAAKPAVSGYQIAASGVNSLSTIEIPAEINFMVSSNIGIRAFGEYEWNTDADSRAKNSGVKVNGTAINGSSGNDDTAWMLGVAIGSAKDLKAFEGNKMAKGDWSARLWYQDVGVWSVDANAVDSDFMDSRVNMKGTVLKTQYNLEDNVFVNFAYGHAKRKNNDFGAAGAANDIALNLKDFDLLQLDLTYKF